MNKKAMAGLIGTIITGVLAILLIVNLAAPQIKSTTTPSTAAESVVRDDAPNFENVSLTYDNLTSITITGLDASNFTTNLSTGVVTFSNTTINASYNSTYSYYADNYIDDSGNRSMMAVILLVLIVGLVAWLFGQFT